MKKTLFLFFIISSLCAQEVFKESKNSYSLQLDYAISNIYAKDEIQHLITNSTESFWASFNKKTYGEKKWQQKFNYPDVGISFGYFNFKNPSLGKMYSLFTHYNFYLLNREAQNQLVLSFGTGIGYVTKPYDKETNSKNIVLGSHLNIPISMKFYYSRENIIDRIGIKAGLDFYHASNGSSKAPNRGINTIGLSLGVNYNLDENVKPYIHSGKNTLDKEKFHLNLSLLFGANEPDFIDIGRYPFFVVSTYLDKRLNEKHSVNFGVDLHLHQAIKELIKYNHIFNGNVTTTNDVDWKRASAFIGYELLFNKSALITQLGAYFYNPYNDDGIIYERIGIKRYVKKSYFATVSIKAHLFDAEALEFGIGYRF